MKSTKYVPNLAKMQQVCSRNYALLLRAIPLEYEQGESWSFQINPMLHFVLTVNKLSPYTEDMTLRMHDSTMPKYMNTEIEFRLYHDAQMVEVTSFQKQTRLRQSYPYPNPKLHHKDEKMQNNMLLKDWLNMATTAARKVNKTTSFNSAN